MAYILKREDLIGGSFHDSATEFHNEALGSELCFRIGAELAKVLVREKGIFNTCPKARKPVGGILEVNFTYAESCITDVRFVPEYRNVQNPEWYVNLERDAFSPLISFFFQKVNSLV